MAQPRRFPAPSTVEDIGAAFVVNECEKQLHWRWIWVRLKRKSVWAFSWSFGPFCGLRRNSG